MSDPVRHCLISQLNLRTVNILRPQKPPAASRMSQKHSKGRNPSDYLLPLSTNDNRTEAQKRNDCRDLEQKERGDNKVFLV